MTAQKRNGLLKATVICANHFSLRAQTGWDYTTRSDAEIQLKKLIEKYGKTAPDLSSWLENELPEGFTVFNVEPDSLNARRKLRTTNMVEFQNKELKKRTRCIRVFPNKESLLRIATALLIELDEKWLADGKVYQKG